jgi:hypothetical protein
MQTVRVKVGDSIVAEGAIRRMARSQLETIGSSAGFRALFVHLTSSETYAERPTAPLPGNVFITR